MARRSFTTEFRRETAKLVVEQGYSISQACKAVDVGETAVRRWVAQYKAELSGVTPKSKALTPEQQKIQELERQVQRLNREKEILKKAAAFFATEIDPNLK